MSEDNEIRTYFGRCRCCLNYGYLKNMWMEHRSNGEIEIYGEMLVQCFALSFERSQNEMEEDQICESCILKLREAFTFKNAVLNAQEELLKEMEQDCKTVVKIEDLSEQSELEESFLMVYDPSKIEQESLDQSAVDTVAYDAEDMEYEEVEFLEEEDDTKVTVKENSESGVTSVPETSTTSSSKTDETQPQKKTKWPKKLPKNERYKTYKQYTAEDLRNCIEAVAEERMTPQEACQKYNIPQKTILAKVKLHKDAQVDPNKEKTYNFIQEVKTILTYTNATPYKSKANRFHCAYCSSEGPIFEDPSELRTHTRSAHVNDRTSRIEFAMRPHWLNEVLKIDIHNLICNVCCISLLDWNDMFRHLRDQHKVKLDQSYTRLIPYILEDNLKCALCKQSFSSYMHLDGHMNAHYDNYICGDCGDTFISSCRLRQHMKIHDVGKFPCKYCSKVFTLDKYRKKHEELVHEHVSKHKCLYCPEKFMGEYLRHLHVVDKHNEKVNVITCELCGKTFTWRPYYLAHVRKKHDKNRADCEVCGKTIYKTKANEAKNSKEKKMLCGICTKTLVFNLEPRLRVHKKRTNKKT